MEDRDELFAAVGADALRGAEAVAFNGTTRHGEPVGDRIADSHCAASDMTSRWAIAERVILAGLLCRPTATELRGQRC
ncbi:hypothetical protein [Mycolicibacterium austroafricanum]|uniref:hypothetical protein n=1 Tax=Mycolicibacterium austroafricanum TaxID=39687 RepID=UPI001CA3545B|nr:hypothetical protein [Mycolicibacterium austroafricanum]QZT60703.1 hypothetical protein JN085_16820 [Mycolicibacterium austroafricanum]